MIDLARLRQAFPERQILYFDSIDSTQRIAAASEPGTIVLADRQLAGQGRHGHTWHSEPGTGIYCSLRAASVSRSHPRPRHRRRSKPSPRPPASHATCAGPTT